MNKLDQLIKMAIEEDVGSGDITAQATVPLSLQAVGRFRAKQELTLAGIDTAHRVFQAIDPNVKWQAMADDGNLCKEGCVLAVVEGRARSLLAAERIALNFLMRLCGIATLARRFAEAVKGTDAVILDTRKTAPGFRELEKHAARMGGCQNHRMGLFDCFLIKGNHIAAAGSICNALNLAIGARKPDQKVEVETRTQDDVREALRCNADIIMLDNMTVDQVREAVKLVDKKARIEVSGNVTLANVRAYAETGVDFISVGAITHSAPAADINMTIEIV